MGYIAVAGSLAAQIYDDDIHRHRIALAVCRLFLDFAAGAEETHRAPLTKYTYMWILDECPTLPADTVTSWGSRTQRCHATRDFAEKYLTFGALRFSFSQ